MRLALVFGMALLVLAAPRAAGAQTYCASGSSGSSGYASYIPTSYTSYTGFASFPGGMASGVLPFAYRTNPYVGCAPSTPLSSANPTDLYGSATSPPSYSAVIASNVYNPYSGWGLTNAASYPFASHGNNPSAASAGNNYGGANLYTGYAGFPGMAPSGYLTAGTSASPAQVYSYGTTASPPGATSSYGGYTPTASAFDTGNGGYYNAAGVPIYYGGANAGNSSAATSAGYSTGSGATGYYTYGNGAAPAAPYSGVSTMLTYGCGGNC